MEENTKPTHFALCRHHSTGISAENIIWHPSAGKMSEMPKPKKFAQQSSAVHSSRRRNILEWRKIWKSQWCCLYKRYFKDLTDYAPIICHPLGGGGTPGKGGDFVKDPVKVLIFPLLGGDTEESKFPSLRGITLSSLKPDKKTVLYTLNEMSCFNSAYMFVTMQISMYC